MSSGVACKYVPIGIRLLYRNGGPGGGCNSFAGLRKLIGCTTCKTLFEISDSIYNETAFESKLIEGTKDAEFPTPSRYPSYDTTQWSHHGSFPWDTPLKCQYQGSKEEGGTAGV